MCESNKYVIAAPCFRFPRRRAYINGRISATCQAMRGEQQQTPYREVRENRKSPNQIRTLFFFWLYWGVASRKIAQSVAIAPRLI
jgi:hypothetical protein